MVALTLCEAARSPFDIICGARASAGLCASVCACAACVGSWVIMQGETSRRRGCSPAGTRARFINISNRRASANYRAANLRSASTRRHAPTQPEAPHKPTMHFAILNYFLIFICLSKVFLIHFLTSCYVHKHLAVPTMFHKEIISREQTSHARTLMPNELNYFKTWMSSIFL